MMGLFFFRWRLKMGKDEKLGDFKGEATKAQRH